MKLDYDLIRDILLYVEEQADGHTNYLWENLYNKFPGETPDKLQYHKKYLIDSGMIDGNSRAFIDLTPYGHEYIGTIREDTIWEKTKSEMKSIGGSVSLDIIQKIAIHVVEKLFGL